MQDVFNDGSWEFLILVGRVHLGENPLKIPSPLSGSSFSLIALKFNKLNPRISAWSPLLAKAPLRIFSKNPPPCVTFGLRSKGSLT